VGLFYTAPEPTRGTLWEEGGNIWACSNLPSVNILNLTHKEAAVMQPLATSTYAAPTPLGSETSNYNFPSRDLCSTQVGSGK